MNARTQIHTQTQAVTRTCPQEIEVVAVGMHFLEAVGVQDRAQQLTLGPNEFVGQMKLLT